MEKVFISIVISLSLALFIATKRKIGFWWGLFFSIFFSPLIGIIFILLSPKKSQPLIEKNTVSKTNIFIGLALLGIGIFLIYKSISLFKMKDVVVSMVKETTRQYAEYNILQASGFSLSVGIGLIGAGIYINRGQFIKRQG